MANQKLTSAMYHLNVAKSDLAKPRIHLMQAESIIPKRYSEVAKRIEDTRKLLDKYDDAIASTLTVIQSLIDNPPDEPPTDHVKKSK